MQHAAAWTSLASPHRYLLVKRFPEYAACAREFVRSRPDVRALEFKFFWVSNQNGGQVDHLTIELESPDCTLWVEVRDDGAGLVARAGAGDRTLRYSTALQRSNTC